MPIVIFYFIIYPRLTELFASYHSMNRLLPMELCLFSLYVVDRIYWNETEAFCQVNSKQLLPVLILKYASDFLTPGNDNQISRWINNVLSTFLSTLPSSVPTLEPTAFTEKVNDQCVWMNYTAKMTLLFWILMSYKILYGPQFPVISPHIYEDTTCKCHMLGYTGKIVFDMFLLLIFN